MAHPDKKQCDLNTNKVDHKKSRNQETWALLPGRALDKALTTSFIKKYIYTYFGLLSFWIPCLARDANKTSVKGKKIKKKKRKWTIKTVFITSTSHNALELVAEVAVCRAVVLRKTYDFFL